MGDSHCNLDTLDSLARSPGTLDKLESHKADMGCGRDILVLAPDKLDSPVRADIPALAVWEDNLAVEKADIPALLGQARSSVPVLAPVADVADKAYKQA